MLAVFRKFIITLTLNQINIICSIKMHQDKKGMIISSLGTEEDFIEEVRFEVDN